MFGVFFLWPSCLRWSSSFPEDNNNLRWWFYENYIYTLIYIFDGNLLKVSKVLFRRELWHRKVRLWSWMKIYYYVCVYPVSWIVSLCRNVRLLFNWMIEVGKCLLLERNCLVRWWIYINIYSWSAFEYLVGFGGNIPMFSSFSLFWGGTDENWPLYVEM